MAALIVLSALALSSPTAAEKPNGLGGKDLRLEWYIPDRPLSDTLAGLAKRSGKDPDDYRIPERDAKASVITIDVAQTTFAIVVQEVVPIGVPGKSAQQLVLLTKKGKVLDRVRCEINSRYGTTKTEIAIKPDPDGAQLVVRFVGQTFPSGERIWWHNWHTIDHDGSKHTYWCPETRGPDVWDEKGLCRIKIVDGKFVIVFPDPKVKVGFYRVDERDEKPKPENMGSSGDTVPNY